MTTKNSTFLELIVGLLSIMLVLVSAVSSAVAGADNATQDLIQAVIRGNLDRVKSLLDGGADVNAKLKDGSTAMWGAASAGKTDMAKLLKAHGAKMTLPVAAMLGDEEEIRRLLAAGADINAREDHPMGNTALIRAVMSHSVGILKLLIDRGVDLSVRNNRGDTAMKMALFFSVTMEEEKERNPSEGAKEADLAEIVNLLLDKGAEVDVNDNLTGKMALIWAARNERLDVAKLVLDKGFDVKTDPNILILAADIGHSEVVNLLLERGADINSTANTLGGGPLMTAAEKGRLEVVKLLLAKGADVNEGGRMGFTPLMAASEKGQLDIVKELLDKGADINARSQCMGSTALSIARDYGQNDVEKFLRAHGAKE